MDITVVIPTYNRYEVLKRALRCVYSQSHMPKEVIIVDDGSQDETAQIREEFPHARYIYQNNAGVSSARNTGIKNSTCQWIAFLDSDDVWHADKLRRHVELHRQNPQLLMSYTDEVWIRKGVEVNVPQKYKKYGGNIFKECLSHCIIAPSAAFLHKDLLREVGLFDESLEVCEDYDLWLRVACGHEIALIDKKLMIKYGGDDAQLSMKHWGMDRFRVKSLEKFLKTKNKSVVMETLIGKYRLLLKGAIKHDRIADIKIYEEKLRDLNA
ncbi:glycosyltransferase family 2 protein [bacterium]|nr:glycosyltransferase family 2 protein [bacterium]MBU1995083.1 glycosyltransferase family 2 protein [bacterium]